MNQQRTGWVGWIYFAGIIMIISGTLNLVSGITGVANPDWVVFDSQEALLLDISGWGWLHIVLGIIIIAAGIGVFSGNVAARTVGVIMAVVSIIANFLYLPNTPFWSIVIIVIDMLVIWAMTVHGDELESA